MAEIEQALRAIDGERASIAALQEQLPARERELLQADADEAAFAALDAQQRAHERRLARLDYLEVELVDRAHAVAAVDRDRALRAAVIRYKEAAAAWAETGAAAIAAREQLREAIGIAAGLGAMNLAMPTDHLNVGELARVADAARHVPDRPPVATPQPMFAVRFATSWNVYNGGEVAGFPAAAAWHLVDAGIAVWATRHRPPHPAPDPRTVPAPPPSADGRVRVRMLKGWKPEPHSLEPVHLTGSVVALLPDVARDAVQSGAAEYVVETGDVR